MLFTLAAVVIFATIVTFFSQEFMGIFKKIMAVPGMIVLLPLALASAVVYLYQPWVVWILYYYRQFLIQIINFLASLLPISGAAYIMHILILTLIATVPVYVLNAMSQKKQYKPYPYPYMVSSFLWLIHALILLIY